MIPTSEPEKLSRKPIHCLVTHSLKLETCVRSLLLSIFLSLIIGLSTLKSLIISRMVSTEHAIDLSQPLSILLTDTTKKAHERAENSPGAKLLLSGKLSKVQYTQFLMMLWHVYE